MFPGEKMPNLKNFEVGQLLFNFFFIILHKYPKRLTKTFFRYFRLLVGQSKSGKHKSPKIAFLRVKKGKNTLPVGRHPEHAKSVAREKAGVKNQKKEKRLKNY